MKFAVICDTHLSPNMASSQWSFLRAFSDMIKKARINTVFTLGDVTSYGEREAFAEYKAFMSGFEHYCVIGNSDVRNPSTEEELASLSPDISVEREGKTFLLINTAYGGITENSRKRIAELSDGDVLCMHHYVDSLDKDSKDFLIQKAAETALTIIHGHRHNAADYILGKSRVIGLRAADPDKSIGGFPCIYCFDTEDGNLRYDEITVDTPISVLCDAEKYFGISCVDNTADITYALENNVYGIELRCNGSEWKPDDSLIPLLSKWRSKTNGYLSVHMPNLRYKDGAFTGGEQWEEALLYAKRVAADGITMHPPRARVKDMIPDSHLWNKFLSYYTSVAESMPEKVNLGIENMHFERHEVLDDTRGFGYTPPEISLWIDAINNAIGKKERVRHLLDVGHARSNGLLAQIYPVSRWYESMGQKTIGYHIHQVSGITGNHHPLESWLGPDINYSSFFHCWERNMLNHAPIFLEVKGWENYRKSIEAFKKLKEAVK